jgi:hypothetical protein
VIGDEALRLVLRALIFGSSLPNVRQAIAITEKTFSEAVTLVRINSRIVQFRN